MNPRIRPRRTIHRRVLASALLVASAQPVAAADWTYRGQPYGAQPLQIDRVVAAGDGYAVIGGPWWLHVGTAGITTSYADLPHDAAAAVGGGVLTLGGCGIALRDIDGRERWQWTAAPPCFELRDRYLDTPFVRDMHGGLWIAPTTADPPYRVQADGQMRPLPPAPQSRWLQFAPIPTAVAAYGIVLSTPRSIARLTPDMIEWTVQAPAGVTLTDLRTAANGDALVAGHAIVNGQSQLYLARHAPDGTVRWARLDADVRALGAELSILADDRFAIGVRDVSHQGQVIADSAVYSYAGNGALEWRYPLGPARFQSFAAPADPDPRRAPSAVGFFTDTPAQFVRLNRLGQFVDASTAAETDSIATLTDGTIVQQRDAATLTVIGPGGRQTLVPTVPLQTTLLRGDVADDGASIVLASVAEAPAWSALQIIEIDRHGALRAQADILAEANGNADVALGHDAERICIGPLKQMSTPLWQAPRRVPLADLQCVRRSDGSTLFTVEPATATADLPARMTLPALRMPGDGRAEMLEIETCDGCAPRLYRATFARDGSRTSRLLGTVPALPVATAIDRDGRAALLSGTTLTTVAADGMLQTTVLALPRVFDGSTLQLLADGGMLVHAQHDTSAALYRLGPDHMLRWTHSLPYTAANGRISIAIDAAAVLIGDEPLIGDARTRRLTVLDAATGVARWTDIQVRQPGAGLAAVAIDAAAGHAVAVHARAGAAMLIRHRLDDGRIAGVQAIDCPDASGCTPIALRAFDDGSIRLFARRLDRAQGLQLQVSQSGPRPPAASVGQAGIAGTWYASDTAGQGVVFEYAPDRGYLHGGWFTYATAGRHRVADQRWYSLQGDVPRGAQEATLTLYAGRDAVFAGASAATLRAVGTATVTLNTCNVAILRYRFDPAFNAGISGEIPLRRLVAAPFACTDATGTAQPSTQTSTAAGIHRGQWGAWFDPTAPGQGLLFDLRPPTATAAGMLLGGWFTYDVAGNADDPQQQHWFMLQGELANARDGVLTVPMFQPIGGSLDRGATRNIVRVGEATLQFDSCEHATFHYRFDAVDVAGPYAGRRGTVALTKLLPCAEQ